jgi:hypothetical protein
MIRARVSGFAGSPVLGTQGLGVSSSGAMFAIPHLLGMFVVDLFKSRSRLEAEISPSSAERRIAAGTASASATRQ